MTRKAGEPFHNKIFFCDIVGYSRLDPVGQQNCIGALQAALVGSLDKLDCEIERDVIALPTGDGMILNFLHPDPAVHLRAALLAMQLLNSCGECPFELRIGLNSFVDSWVFDINGKKNVVGIGINIAQRVMDLGRHAQILMHDDVREQLANYPEFRDHISYRGEFQVKHGVRVPIAQYADPDNAHINNQFIEPVSVPQPKTFDLDSILKSRVKENILTIALDERAKSNLPWILDFIAEFLVSRQVFRQRRVAICWIVSELISNVFEHSRLEGVDVMVLQIDLTAAGALISLKQPHGPAFDVSVASRDEDGIPTFLGMMQQQGFAVHARPLPEGGVDVGVEIPIQIGLGEAVDDPALPSFAVAALAAARAQAPAMLDVEGQSIALHVEHVGTRIVEENWEALNMAIARAISAATEQRRALILDMNGVTYMSSRGLRCLTMTRRDCDLRKVALSIRNLSPALREIFAISRYDRMFDIR